MRRGVALRPGSKLDASVVLVMRMVSALFRQDGMMRKHALMRRGRGSRCRSDGGRLGCGTPTLAFLAATDDNATIARHNGGHVDVFNHTSRVDCSVVRLACLRWRATVGHVGGWEVMMKTCNGLEGVEARAWTHNHGRHGRVLDRPGDHNLARGAVIGGGACAATGTAPFRHAADAPSSTRGLVLPRSRYAVAV